MKLSLITAFSFFIAPTFLFAQNFQRINAPVIQNGVTITSPWTGGVSAPQWSKVDLNGDGKMDLYAFDRDGFIHVPFLNIGEDGEAKYEFAPQFAPNFPKVWNYVLLRDYNYDGVMDFFGHANDEGLPGIKVFKGEIVDNQLKFIREEFSHYPTGDVITVPTNNNGFANLQAASVDYPAIDDIDGDGDLDIIEMMVESGVPTNKIIFYKNFALEQGFTTDTLIFKKEDECWLKVFLPSISSEFNLSGDPDTCATNMFSPDIIAAEKGGVHGASSLCTFDADNDGDKELLYGDINYSTIRYAYNNGTPENGWATDQDTTFPSYNAQIDMPDFPAAYYLDFDNDGLNDLLVSPNEFNVSPDQEVWFYKNVSSNELPLFNINSKIAMVDQMIDIGTSAQPAFFDHNGDGLIDFVVGNFETKQTSSPSSKPASLFLYENIGTSTEPSFQLIDKDWLGFEQFSLSSSDRRFAFAPAIGDIDQDGDDDLLVGEEKGFLFFVENIAGMGNPPQWGPVQPQWKGIDVGLYSTPCIFDLNKDGLSDLLIGERNGNINYYQNIGTVNNPQFSTDQDAAPNNKFLGAIDTKEAGVSEGFSAPVILDFVDTVYIVTGTKNGFIEMYEVDENKLEFGDTFNLVSKQFAGLRTGSHSRITIANINDDDILDAIIGNHRGGLGLFSSPFSVDGSVNSEEVISNLEFEIYPNPAKNILNINIQEPIYGDTKYQLISLIGQTVKQGVLKNRTNEIDISGVAQGMYLLQLNQGKTVGIKKLIIH